MTNTPKRRKLAWRISIVSGGVVVLCTLFLVLSFFWSTLQEVVDKSLVKSMEEAVQLDAAVSIELTAERERQTNRSLARDKAKKYVSWVLIAGAGVFLLAVNWKKSLDGSSALPFEVLQRYRRGTETVADSLVVPLWELETSEVAQLDLTYVEQIVEQEGQSADAAIPILRAVQQRYGYLPDDALKKVCELTEITPAQIAGTSTFYSQFRRSPVGKHLVKVCHGTACHVSGAVQVTEELRRFLAIPDDADTDPTRTFTVEKVACIGCCSLAPVMMVDEHTVGRLTPVQACRALNAPVSEEPA